MDRNIEKKKARFRYRGSIVGPIILITIGLVILLNNLGYVTGDIWETMLKLWPILLVAIGLDSVLRGNGVTGPLLFIGIGLVIILSNFGLVGWDIWDLLLKLWPILLIAIGLDILISRRSIWGALLSIILLVVILLAAIWYFGTGPGVVSTERMEIVQSLDGADQAGIVLKPSFGSASLSSFSNSEDLLEGTINKWIGETIQKEYHVVDGKADFSLKSEGLNGFRSSLPSKPEWDIKINNEVPVMLDFELGAGDVYIDFHDLVVNEFSIGTAVGKIEIILPSQGNVTGRIENPIGSIKVIVPANTALQLTAETGLTNIQVPANYQNEADTYFSPGYSSAEDHVELIISQAFGLVRVVEEGR